MHGVSIRLEARRAVRIPFQHQRPQVRVVLAQEPKLSNSLIVAEPASASRCSCVDWAEKVIFLAPLSTVGFVPSGFDKRRFFGFRQVVKPLRLISCDANILHSFFGQFCKNLLLKPGIAPRPTLKRPSLNTPNKFAFCCSSVFSANHVKAILIRFLTPDVLNLNPPSLLDDLVSLCLKLHHRRQICRYRVSGPNFSVNNSVKRPA